MKGLLKLVYSCQSYHKKTVWLFYFDSPCSCQQTVSPSLLLIMLRPQPLTIVSKGMSYGAPSVLFYHILSMLLFRVRASLSVACLYAWILSTISWGDQALWSRQQSTQRPSKYNEQLRCKQDVVFYVLISTSVYTVYCIIFSIDTCLLSSFSIFFHFTYCLVCVCHMSLKDLLTYLRTPP